MPLVTTPAIVLRAYPYGDTSLILRFLTPDLGVVSAVAKGAKRPRSRLAGDLDTFNEGTLSLYVKPSRELQTLRDFAAVRGHRTLAAEPLRFAGASILVELLLRHGGEEANPALYERVRGGLRRLEEVPAGELLPRILGETWGLVTLLGFGPELRRCVQCGGGLGRREVGRFDLEAGGVRCAGCAAGFGGPRVGPGARTELAALAAGSVPGTLSRPRTHLRLLRDFVTFHVSGGRPLSSFAFLARVAGG